MYAPCPSTPPPPSPTRPVASSYIVAREPRGLIVGVHTSSLHSPPCVLPVLYLYTLSVYKMYVYVCITYHRILTLTLLSSLHIM